MVRFINKKIREIIWSPLLTDTIFPPELVIPFEDKKYGGSAKIKSTDFSSNFFNMLKEFPQYKSSGGKMVSVNKGDWDTSLTFKEKHKYNRKWLKLCKNVMKDDGTIWVSGTSLPTLLLASEFILLLTLISSILKSLYKFLIKSVL